MKPTEPYIAHIMARPEFRAKLNEEKKRLGWTAGDYGLIENRHSETGYIGPYLVVGAHEPIHPIRYWRVDVVRVDFYQDWPEIERQQTVARTQWLPSLSQLLGMVEAAGWGWQFTRRGHRRISMSVWLPDKAFSGKHIQQVEPAIAAASLLERLWEEG